MSRLAWRVALVALAVFVLALSVRLVLLLLFFPFDGLYGQDAFAYYAYAQSLQRAVSELRAPSPFAWPLGYPALLAVAFALLGNAPAVAQGVTLLCGAMVAPLVYLWTHDLSTLASGGGRNRDGALAWSPVQGQAGQAQVEPERGDTARAINAMPGAGAGALLAGLVAAFGGQLAQSSLVVMSDAPALWWAGLGALGFTRYAATRRTGWLLAASLAFTFGALTRWVYAAPAALSVAGFWLLWRGAPAKQWRRDAALALALPLPFLFFQWLSPTALQWIGAWHPANAFARVFDSADGRIEYSLPPALFNAAPLAHNLYFSTFLLPFTLAGAWQLRRAPAAVRLLVWGWFVVVYLCLAGMPLEDIRFGLALWLPPIALAGVGFAAVWGAAIGRYRVFWRPLLVALVALAMLGMAGGGRDALAPLVALQRTHLAVVRATIAAVPANSTLIALGMGGYFRQSSPELHTLELASQSPATLERLACTPTPTFLLVEPGSIAGQWAAPGPARNVRFLRERVGLVEAAQLGTFVLYRVGGACA